MNIHLDLQDIKHAALYGATLFAVFYIWSHLAGNLGAFVYEVETIALIPSLPRREHLTLRELPADALVLSNGSEVIAARDEFIAAKEDFIFADLNAMNIALYKEGRMEAVYLIVAKGKDGSFYETPNGIYTVKTKARNHFSSIGKVWMPWSVHFFANYFIHGIPYYTNGVPVSDSFSGGCIRLPTDQAEALFRAAGTGMPVLVYSSADRMLPDESYYKKADNDGGLSEHAVSAQGAIAVDFESGNILWEKNRDAAYPIASITKLMTALVAVESINRYKILSMDAVSLRTAGDSASLLEGDTFQSEEWLYPMLLTSSNDIAARYQREVWGFTTIMNQKARALGMTETFFDDPTGLSPRNISSVQDLYRLLRFLAEHKKPVFDITGLARYEAVSRSGGKKHEWLNMNWNMKDQRFIAGKSGTSPEALQNMAGVFGVKFGESGTRPVAIIVLGSQDRVSDTDAIIAYLERDFVYGAAIAEEQARREGKTVRIIREGASIWESMGEFLPGLLQ